MASTGEHDSNAVLSDVESEEDPVPILLDTPSPDGFSGERFLQLVASLDRERQARQFAENSFNRLKVLTHEAIKMREDAGRSNERLSEELAEALRAKDDVLKQRDEVAKQLEELVKAKEELRSEIESSARILVTGIEKIGVKVSGYRNFSAGGLPRSPKYSGLPAIAYGFINRTNEIVEDLLNQLEVARKSRNDAREQIEQRNYEIAIEVSQLESTISGFKQQLAKKSLEADNLEKAIAHKDAKIFEMDREMLELRRKGEGYACTVRSLELKMDSQQGLIIDQLNYMSKAQEQLNQIMKMVDANVLDRIELLDSASISNELDENLHYSLDGMMSIHELLKVAVEKVRDGMEERNHEEKGLKDTVTRLVNEKRQIGSLLRSVLSKKMISDPSSKGSNALQVAGNGFRKEGLDLRFSDMGAMEIEVDEVYTLVGALEEIVKMSQLQIIELQHSVEVLRTESSLLKTHLESQEKVLGQRMQQIKELEERERAANESVEGLMMDVAAAEEEIARWKAAAEQEAAAGRSVEKEFEAQLSALRQELEAAKQTMVNSENKLKFKEETAAAAMAARDAAENSLKLADLRSSRLRERLEELTHQLEESDTQEGWGNQNRQRYACWPCQWLGLNLVGFQAVSHQSLNEMELSEPLL